MTDINTTAAGNNNRTQRIPPRILSSLLASVAAGVVPREGAPYIAIGRKDEITAILQDLEHVNNGGGAMRFLIGRYGSGKSFLIQLIRGYALECNLCGLTPKSSLLKFSCRQERQQFSTMWWPGLL